MRMFDFLAVTSEIEKELEGDGYWIVVILGNGGRIEGSWRRIGQTSGLATTNMIGLNRHEEGSHETFVDVGAIDVVRRSKR